MKCVFVLRSMLYNLLQFFADFTIVVSVVVITIIIIICENGNAHQKGKTTKLVSQPLLIYVYMYIFNTIMHKQL